MNENTFLNLGNNNQASQSMGMNPIGGDASFAPMGGDPNAMGAAPDMMGGDPNMMGGDPNMMGGDPNMMGDDNQNEPVMGADPFEDSGDAEVSSDPEKKAESLAGQLASIFRKELKSDGINTHEDKKKEVLGMVASAIVDGMNDDDRNSMIEYLSDKLNGSGESDGDDEDDNGGNDTDAEMNNQGEMYDNQMPQEMSEKKINEFVDKLVREMVGNGLTNNMHKKIKTKIEQPELKGYKSYPYTNKK